MAKKVLVAYASKYGATAGIAEKIGEVLSEAGLTVDVAPADKTEDPASYAGVVLGSAVYIGGWRKEAVKFLKKNRKKLAERPVWIFSSGPTGEGDPVELVKGWRYPKKLGDALEEVEPVDITVFHGAIDSEKLNALERFAIKNVKAEPGDFRDWEAITAWAKKIAAKLKK
ncbi:MAG: flavodoxin domain-containing protein [Dehalococcoidia bacterium]|jgi:menaquinone-dependent protoporphyrinogen oxidase